MMKKIISIVAFGILSFILGAASGAIVWLILKIMDLGIEFFWTWLPEKFNADGSLIYFMTVCLIGGCLIGLWQKKYGLLPDELPVVLGKIHKDGRYPYDNLHILAVSALLPLIFGGALGPEAGFTGIIAGLCCLVGDRLRYKGEKVAALAETGMSATLGVIFGSPLFGIIDSLEPDNENEHYKAKLVDKKTRIFVYVCGVAGGMLIVKGLTAVLGGGMGLSRFDRAHGYGIEQWKWIIPLILAGIAGAFIYLIFNKLTSMIGNKLKDHIIVRCMLGGAVLALVGWYVPLTMLSGETDMGTIMADWQTMSVSVLFVIAVCKLFLVNFCLNMGWRGGSIFPIIFSGVAIGFAFALMTGMDGAYAVAVVCGAIYGYIMRKPVTVIAVLLLCFPVTYIVPLGISAFIASKIPMPRCLVE